MNRQFLILAFISVSHSLTSTAEKTNEPIVTINSDTGNPSNESNLSVEELITKAESWFNSDSDLEGYEIYHQDVDRINDITKYIHKKFPDQVYQRNQTDSMQKLVIFEQGPLDKQTFIVFRQTPSHPKHYTGHLAYIRKFRGQVSVEWDILKSRIDEPKEIFAAAFTPYMYGINSVFRNANVTRKVSQDTEASRRRKRSKHTKGKHGRKDKKSKRQKKSWRKRQKMSKKIFVEELVDSGEMNPVSAEHISRIQKKKRKVRSPIIENLFQLKNFLVLDDILLDRTLREISDVAPPDTGNINNNENSETKDANQSDKNGPIQEKARSPNDTQFEDKENETKTEIVPQPNGKTKRPVIIPNRVFDDSKETSASIELSIEDEPFNNIKKGRYSKKSRNKKKRRRLPPSKRRKMGGRYLQPLGAFFGSIDLNHTVPEKRIPNINEDYPDENEEVHNEEKMIIKFDSKNNHPIFEDKSSPFTGILECKYENVSLSTGEFFKFTSNKKSEFARFLLKSLRAHCLNEMRENTLSLFLEDLISLGSDMKVNLNMANPIYKKKTLNKDQWDKLISAIYFTIYADAYKHHAELIDDGNTYSRSPDAIKISLSTRTLTTMIIRGVEIIHDMETHAVKISKSLITTLNERYLLSIKEANLLKSECKDCFDEEDTNYQDRIQLRALKEFVIFGVEDTFGKKGSEMDHAFIEFYEKRLPILTGKSN